MSEDNIITNNNNNNNINNNLKNDIGAFTSWFNCFGEKNIHEIKEDNPGLTRGAFGEISLAIFRDDDDNADKLHGGGGLRVVALKTLYQSTVSMGFGSSSERILSREVFGELCALRLLNPHPHIASLLAVYPTRGCRDGIGAGGRSSLTFAFEYCPVDLYLSLEWRRRAFMPALPFGVIKTISRDIFSALQHCHMNNVIHRDVKSGNLLVSSSGMIQLCDFGIAKPIDNDNVSTSRSSTDHALCTLYYRPPEVLLGARASHPSVDVYSAGIVIAELLAGRTLFRGRNDLDQLAKIFEILGTPSDSNWPGARNTPDYGKLHFCEKSPRNIDDVIPRLAESEHLSSFLKSLISLDPTKRLTGSSALTHDWLAGGYSPRSDLLTELIPDELEEPILLTSSSSSDSEFKLAQRQALSLAAARRRFLSKLVDESRNGSNSQ